MKLPKIPIDYSKAGSGEAPFDKQYYILFCESEEAKVDADDGEAFAGGKVVWFDGRR